MNTSGNCLGYAPPEAMWGGDAGEGGYYALNQGIALALKGRRYLGYVPGAAAWESTANDFGYYAINGSIRRALRSLSARS